MPCTGYYGTKCDGIAYLEIGNAIVCLSAHRASSGSIKNKSFTWHNITYYKGFPEQSTPVFNFCLFINERQGIRLRYYKRSC